MRAGISVGYTDNTTHTTTAVVPDFVAWERRSKRRTSDLASGIAVEDLAFLAWHALKRTGLATSDFDTWLNGVAEVELTEIPAPKAIPSEVSPGSSSN